MRHLSMAAAALILSISTVSAADPAGTYRVEGTNPGGGSGYTGTVTVERTGETYRVVWVVGGVRYTGTGLGDKNFIAVSYRSGNDTGLALYGEDGGNWLGLDRCRWTQCRHRGLEAALALKVAGI
jgi:hypothetical protein